MFSKTNKTQLAESLEVEGDSQAERLERMKSEFLAAQRRRGRAPYATARPDDTNNGPPMAGPADETLTAIAAVRPLTPLG
jgi:hypothetical protein